MGSDHIFRIRFKIGGGHIHCRLFAAANRRDPAWAKCGEFTVCKGAEFSRLLDAFKCEVLAEPDEAYGIEEACTP